MLDRIADTIYDWLQDLDRKLYLSDRALVDLGIGFIFGYTVALWVM